MEYPTRRGIAIHPNELALPPSELDIENEKLWNNHHMEWTKRAMAQNAMLQTLRDLDRLQVYLPIDTHNELHRRYRPPELPTPKEAAVEIMEAYELGEDIKVYKPYKGYVWKPIPQMVINGIKKHWSSY